MQNDVIRAWLLAWNPKKFDWDNVDEPYTYDMMVQTTKKGEAFFDSWRCISSKVKIGDRVFIIRLGEEPKGIIATGFAASESYEDDTRVVDTLITSVLDYKNDAIIPQEQLKEKFPDQQWSPQGSGISIKPEAARWLIDNWESYQNYETNTEDNSPKNEPVIWKISHGTPQTSGITSEIRQILENKNVVIVNQFTDRLAVQKVPQGETYMKEIKKGDYFFLCYAGEIVLFGQFTGDELIQNQEMIQKWDNYDWYERSYQVIARSLDHDKYTGKKKIWTSNYNSTCVKVTDNELFEELILQPYFGLTLADLNPNEYHEPYTQQDFFRDVYMTPTDYDTLTELLRHKQNIILQGAPGVGKTYTAKRLDYAMMGEKDDDRIAFIQFHQSYSYEDFIMGYRPDGNEFRLKYGIFYQFCQTAREHPDKEFFFIIDEINRGNLSKIFGELLMLIEKEYRQESAVLAYTGEKFSVPPNLYLIGMMNTADRSLAMIDYALRRRFSFFDMLPGFASDGFITYRENLQNDTFNALITQIMQLNDAIRQDSSLGDGFCIGHSYFCNLDAKSCTDSRLRSIVKYDILPLLREYWFDDPDSQKKWTDKLCGVFHDE